MENEQSFWFAAYTKSRHEKCVERRLIDQGVTTFLPLINQTKQWSDRKKKIETPLIRSYIFLKVEPRNILYVLQTHGVINIVKIGGQYTKIPDYQIEALKTVLDKKLNLSPVDYFKTGEYVKVSCGPLKDKIGKISQIRGKYRLILSIDAISYAFSTPISPDMVIKVKIVNEGKANEYSTI